MDKGNIIEQCYQKSIELLLENSNKFGLMASSLNKKSKESLYTNIFGRDASISSLGMVISKNKNLIFGAKKSLLTLAKFQSKLGEILFSIKIEKKEANFYYMGSLDSTLWWLIAVDFYNKYSNDKKLYKKLKPKIDLALEWLFYQDQNNCGLLEQGETNDWADLMPRRGTVLYTNALWCKVLELYGFKKERKLAIDGLNNLFLPFSANLKRSKFLQTDVYKIKLLNDVKKTVKKKEYYLNYVSTHYGNDRCDVYGNILALIFGVALLNKKEKIINYFIKEKISKFYPIKVFFPAIKKGDEDYKKFLEHRKLNYPNQYHNGGIWPYVGGFWAILLYKSRRKKLAFEVLKNLAKANKINNWEFNEWFHGITGKPMGMKGQSWNAGMFILAYHYLKNDFKF